MFKPSDRVDLEVIRNVFTVHWAAEKWAARNNGIYPCCVSGDENFDGHTLIDLLPGGRLLLNPYYKIPTEPTDGAAAFKGNGAYMICWGNGQNRGYTITGCGTESGTVIVTLCNDCDSGVTWVCFLLWGFEFYYELSIP
jgi:hypothetical protein